VVVKDIFTDRRYEDVIPNGHMVQIPQLIKKDYLLITIEDDGYVTLLDETICDTRNDLKLNMKSDLGRQLLEK
jgi:translation elongation factor P/translation initiation factor 5A